MNKAICTLTLLIVCIASTCTGARAATVADARRGIKAAIEKRMAARQSHDAAAYLSTFEPTWTLTSVTGKTQTYAAMRKTMIDRLAHLTTAQMFKMSWRITSITTSGGEAHAAITVHYDYPPRRTPHGLAYVYQDTVSDTVWDKTPAGWTQRSERYLFDSKVFSTRAIVVGERRTPGF